uniref:Uncharacterized protein n=1 Tax=Oryza meridionalis TaxID=40149 RepID=A0A0E0EE78_9ORYZ
MQIQHHVNCAGVSVQRDPKLQGGAPVEMPGCGQLGDNGKGGKCGKEVGVLGPLKKNSSRIAKKRLAVQDPPTKNRGVPDGLTKGGSQIKGSTIADVGMTRDSHIKGSVAANVEMNENSRVKGSVAVNIKMTKVSQSKGSTTTVKMTERSQVKRSTTTNVGMTRGSRTKRPIVTTNVGKNVLSNAWSKDVGWSGKFTYIRNWGNTKQGVNNRRKINQDRRIIHL